MFCAVCSVLCEEEEEEERKEALQIPQHTLIYIGDNASKKEREKDRGRVRDNSTEGGQIHTRKHGARQH